MKKILLSSILLVTANAVMSSQNEHELLHKIVPDKPIKPCVVGFKKFTAQDLLALDEKYREVLNKTAEPSYIERCFGMDNHTVSLERRDELTNLPKEVKEGMRLEVLPIKRSYCINGCGTPNGCWVPNQPCGPTTKGVLVGGFVSIGLGFATIPASSISSLFCLLLIPTAMAPFCGAACGECTTCVHYRCCAEREQVVLQEKK